MLVSAGNGGLSTPSRKLILILARKFQYLGVLFMSEGTNRVEDQPENWCSISGFLLTLLHHFDKKRAEPEGKGLDLSVNLHSFPHLRLRRMGHDRKNEIQAAEMDFLWRAAGISLREKVRSSVTREGLGVEPMLLCLERTPLRWFRHLERMPPSRLSREVFQAHPAGKRLRGRPRSRWRDYISALA